MARLTRAVVGLPALLLPLALAACGDPLVVLGDAPGIMRIVLGVGDSIGVRVDTLATRTRLTDPRAVAFNPGNHLLYVGDRGAVRQVGGTSSRVARIFAVTSRGRSTLLLDSGGCVGAVCIFETTDMAVAQDGALLIADAVGNRIFRYLPGGALTVLAGTGIAASAADGAVAAGAPVDRPSGIAVASDGRIFFSEQDAHRVRVIQPGGTLGTVAGTGQRGLAEDAVPAINANIDGPAGLHWHDGFLFIAMRGDHTVRVVEPNGILRSIAGLPGGSGYSGDAGPASAARLNRPDDVAVSPNGRAVFVSDAENDRVRVVDLDTGMIDTFAGTGDPRYTGNRLTAGQTSLSRPAGIAAHGGFIFIADLGHSVVWRTSIGFD